MRIAYCRVSSREQAENSHALEQQEERLVNYGVDEVFSDVDSGKKDSRISFLRLWELIDVGLVKVVVCTRLDRLTRSLLTLRKFIDHVEKHQVSLIVLDENIDTGTHAGKFQINMLGALSEMEVDRLSERVKHGWNHLRSKRVAMHPPFGYVKVDDKHQLNHEPFLCLLENSQSMSRVAVALDIVNLFLQIKSLRLTVRAINQKYGIQHFSIPGVRKIKAVGVFRFSFSGLRGWLLNPVLRGHLRYQDYLVYNTHLDQVLISDDDFVKIENILKDNRSRRGYGSTYPKYSLSGLVYCAECGSACFSASSRNRLFYFRCKNWRDRSCSQKSMVRMEVIEEQLVQALCDRSEEISKTLRASESEESVLVKELKSQISQLQIISNPNQIILDAIAKLKAQVRDSEIKNNIAAARGESEKVGLSEIFSDPVFWDTWLKVKLSTDEIRDIYRRYCSKIFIKDGEVESIEFRI